MTKKIVFGAALALVIVGLAAPSTSASCNPPKRASTYNSLTGAFAYWHTTVPIAGSTLVGKLWTGTTDFSGSCNTNPGILYYGTNAGDIGMNLDLGDGCIPGTACPGSTLSVMATITSPLATQFLTTQVNETPGGGVNYDFSATGHPMVLLPRPRVTSSTRVIPNVNLTIAVDAASAGFYEGTASQITGYNILSKASATDPGRLASSFDATPRATLPAPGGTAATGNASVDCSNASLDQWVVTQIVTVAGGSPSVSAATRVNCNQALADPKYKIVPKKGPMNGTISN